MILVDVHAHLDHPLFKNDLDEVIKKAKEENVKAIITCGISPSTNRECLKLSQKYDIIKCAMGGYPMDALSNEVIEDKYPTDILPYDIDSEIKFIKENKKNIIAISEIGLDLRHGKDLDMQKIHFQKFIDLAIEINKPVIVHSRKAELEVIEQLEKSKLKNIVMHCFSGKMKLVKRVIDNGWTLSIPTNIVLNEHFQKMADICPISQILTETDSPFLSPYKSVQRNVPNNVFESIKKISQIKGLDQIETANMIYNNYSKMFIQNF